MDPNNFQPNVNNPAQPVQPPLTQPTPPMTDIYAAQPQPGQPIAPQAPAQQFFASPAAQGPAPQPVQQQPVGTVMPQPNPAQQASNQAMPVRPVVGPRPKKPKFLIIIIVGVVLLIGMTVAGVLLTKPKKKAAVNNGTADVQKAEEATSLLPAKSLDVEQTNAAVNQDISGINDENDFPPTQLDDKALGL